MHAACSARITLQRVKLAVWRVNKVKGDLACEPISFYKCFYPFEYGGVVDVLKSDCGSLPNFKSGRIGCMRRDASIQADAVGADVCPLYIFLRHPGGS